VKSPQVFTGWNLIGNPYHSYINYDLLDLQSDLASTFYIYNSSSGSYSAFSQGSNVLIAPSQGFWVDKNPGPARDFDFEEADKAESHNPAFVRRARNIENTLTLNIREKGSVYNQDHLIKFNPNAQASFDEYDARFLPSPHAEIPAITSKAVNSDEQLMVNSLDNLEMTQIIPLELKSGIKAIYELNAQDLDEVYKSYDCIYLKDKEAEKVVDLSVEPIYEFEAEAGEFDRFELIVSKDYQECQKSLTQETSAVQDLDRVFNLRNNVNGWWLDYSFKSDFSKQIELKVYNLSGQEVIAPASFSGEGSGTIRLNELDNLQGIYLIQIVSEGEILNKTVQL
jgi:hypothetical protein